MERLAEKAESFISLNVMAGGAYMAVCMRRQMEYQDYRLAEGEILSSPDIRIVGLVSQDFMHAIKLTKQNPVMRL